MHVAGQSEDQRSEDVLRPGDVVAGKYRIERVLGRGGMGVVVAATHLRLDERVAIKFLLPSALGNADALGRFEREARAAVKIRSEHVAKVLDVGTLENGAPYMVMEHLEGNDLAYVVRKRGPLPIVDAVTFMLQVCEVLAEAHSMGIVHRDLKPGNLFVTRRTDGTRSIKVLDFGISKLLEGVGSGESPAALTATDMVLGSPIYMSPEQMTTPKAVESRADIWSFGATLFMLLAGKPPFDGTSIAQVCGMILLASPPSLLELRPDAPPGLAEIITRCLQRNLDDRWANVAVLAAALAPFAPEHGHLSAERARRVLETTGSLGAHVPASPEAPVAPPPPSAPPPSAPPPSASPAIPTSASVPPSDSAQPRTIATWSGGEAAIDPARPRRWPLIAAGVAAVLTLGVIIGSFTGRPASATAAAASAVPPADATTSAAALQPSITAPTDTAPPAPSASSARAVPSASPLAAPDRPRRPPPPPPTPSVPVKKKPSGDLFDERL